MRDNEDWECNHQSNKLISKSIKDHFLMGVVHPSSSFENFVFLMRGYDAMSLNMGGVA